MDGALPGNSLHDADFYAWAMEQAALIRAGRLADADMLNIAEEIESLGRSEKRELVSRLSVLLLHLLRWEHQPGRRSMLWRLSVANTRDQLAAHLADNHSLKAKLPETLAQAYRYARRDAASETGLALSTFPVQSPWTFESAMEAKLDDDPVELDDAL